MICMFKVILLLVLVTLLVLVLDTIAKVMAIACRYI